MDEKNQDVTMVCAFPFTDSTRSSARFLSFFPIIFLG